MTNVLGIFGSPRRDGNSALLLEEALAGARAAGAEIRIIRASELTISGCRECNDCYIDGRCSSVDDMDTVFESLEWADRIIFASAIFFMGLPAQAKAIVDRCQRYWALKYVLKQRFPRVEGSPPRYGIFLAVGATRGVKLFEGVNLTMKYFFDSIDVQPVTDLYVQVRGVDEKGEISSKKQALDDARLAGGKLTLM